MAQRQDDWRHEPPVDSDEWLPATLLQTAIEVGLLIVLVTIGVYAWLAAFA